MKHTNFEVPKGKSTQRFAVTVGNLGLGIERKVSVTSIMLRNQQQQHESPPPVDVE